MGNDVLAELSSVEGVSSIQRTVCGGCRDFKIVAKFPAAAFGDWEKSSFAPEAEFLGALKNIAGITDIETQTFTLEEVKLNKKDAKKALEKKGAGKPEEKQEKVLTPEEAEKARKDKLKKVIKEGG